MDDGDSASLADVLEVEGQLGIALLMKEDLGEPAALAFGAFSRGQRRAEAAYPDGDVPDDLAPLILALIQGQIEASRSLTVFDGEELEQTLEYVVRMTAKSADEARIAKLDHAVGSIHAARLQGDEARLQLALSSYDAVLKSSAIDEEVRLSVLLDRAEVMIDFGGVDNLRVALDDVEQVRLQEGSAEVSDRAEDLVRRATSALAKAQGRVMDIRLGPDGTAVLVALGDRHEDTRRGWWRRRQRP